MSTLESLALRVARIHSTRLGASRGEILQGLDRSLLERSRSLRPRLVREGSWRVGEYDVRLERGESNVRLSCSCDFWVYQGPEYHASREGYLLGSPRGTAVRPTTRDPEGRHRVCKHAAAVLSQLEE